MSRHYTTILLAFILSCACKGENKTTNPVVEIKEEKGKFTLYRHGKPYYIKGAAGTEHLEKVSLYGGNSVRTWNMQEADRVLEEADKYGLTVTLGLEVGNEWWGEEFYYWNTFAVNDKIKELKKIILRYKDHPALLMWGVGNEVHLFGGNQLLVLHTIDKIAKMIHEVDPNHPVMTAMPLGPNFSKRGVMRIFCPNIDLLGVNGFKGLPDLYGQIRAPFGWNKPYILSEWGPPGPWETPSTEWGAPVEQSSTLKARLAIQNWETIRRDSTLCLGGYAFYWGTKYERTYSFYSLFSDEGLETGSVNVLQRIWSGKKPTNLAPEIDSMVIHSVTRNENIYLSANSFYKVSIFAKDPDGDPLSYQWELRPEGKDNFVPGDFNNNRTDLFVKDGKSTLEFKTPEQEGGFRLINHVFDGKKHIATQNIPFYVKINK